MIRKLKNVPQNAASPLGQIAKAPNLMATLGGITANNQQIQEIILDKIIIPDTQTRRHIDHEKLQQLAESIATTGVKVPILVTPLDDGNYELVYGQSRVKASLMAEKTTIPAFCQDLSPEERLEIALIENLQRNELSPIDEVDGIIALIKLKFNCDESTVLGMINEAVYYYRGRDIDFKFTVQACNNVIANFGSLQEGIDYCIKFVTEAIESTSQNTIAGFANNKLPLLNLPKVILQAVREGEIAYTKAKILASARITDEQFREELIQQTIAKNLSIRVIRARIEEKYPQQSKSDLHQQWLQTSKKLSDSQIWQDKKKQAKLAKLLAEINSLIE